jgi:hypothetical protein
VQDDDVVSLSEDNGISTGRKIQYYVFQEEREDVEEWSEMMWAVINKLSLSILFCCMRKLKVTGMSGSPLLRQVSTIRKLPKDCTTVRQEVAHGTKWPF